MPWSRAERLAFASLLVAFAGTVAALVVVPEVRVLLALDGKVPPITLSPSTETAAFQAVARNSEPTTSTRDPAAPYRNGNVASEYGATAGRADETNDTTEGEISSQTGPIVSIPSRPTGAAVPGDPTIRDVTTVAGPAKVPETHTSYPFRISEIKLLAVFNTKRGLRVMFSGPDNKGYQARRGDIFADAEIIDIMPTTVQVQTVSGARLSLSVPNYDR